jgi:hypothetical protein
MNADAKLDAALGRQASVALGHAILHLDGAAHGVHHAAEFYQHAVACALDDATVVDRNRGFDEIASQCPEAGKGSIFIRAGEPAEPDDVSG